MRAIDFAPLYRSSVGFDHLARLLDAETRSEPNNNGYPPYNIETLEENNYLITLAVAGFTEEDLEIISNLNSLVVKGKKGAQEKRSYLHQGIASRNFEQKFKLADHVKVVGAKLEHGLLQINLQREIPEAMQPRTIKISSSNEALMATKSNAA